MKCDRWTLPESVFVWIENNIQAYRTILELGSGSGTKRLAEKYSVVSVEHDIEFVNVYDSRYIYAPIMGRWYCVNTLRALLPSSYDLLIIDGPTGTIGRLEILNHLDLFNWECVVIVDDTQRKAEMLLVKGLSERLQREYETIEDDQRKWALFL